MVIKVVAGCYGDDQSWYEGAQNGNGTVFHGQGINLLKAMRDIFDVHDETLQFVTDFEDEVLHGAPTGNDSDYNNLITEIKGFDQGLFDLDMLHYTLTPARFPYVENFLPYRVINATFFGPWRKQEIIDTLPDF